MTGLSLLVALGLAFNFLNGVHDSSNVVATMISSRALRPRLALTLTTLAELAGPFLFGTAVARTFAHDLTHPQAIDLVVLTAALASAILWNLLTWWWGIPSSSSHALFGSLVGAMLVKAGWGAIQPGGAAKILTALFISPIIGLVVGYLVTRLVFFLARNAAWSINWFFKRAQVATAAALALSHGANDAQKVMGVLVLGLIVTGRQDTFAVPLWVVTVCTAAIALGTYVSSWRLIRTLGAKFYRIQPVDGFCAQASAAAVIVSASLLGGPVSTTQVVSSTILGVGAAERVNKVRWTAAVEIAVAWLVTIPITGLLAAGLYALLRHAPGLAH